MEEGRKQIALRKSDQRKMYLGPCRGRRREDGKMGDQAFIICPATRHFKDDYCGMFRAIRLRHGLACGGPAYLEEKSCHLVRKRKCRVTISHLALSRAELGLIKNGFLQAILMEDGLGIDIMQTVFEMRLWYWLVGA